jgi:hypothetical protein
VAGLESPSEGLLVLVVGPDWPPTIGTCRGRLLGHVPNRQQVSRRGSSAHTLRDYCMKPWVSSAKCLEIAIAGLDTFCNSDRRRKPRPRSSCLETTPFGVPPPFSKACAVELTDAVDLKRDWKQRGACTCGLFVVRRGLVVQESYTHRRGSCS